MRDPVARLDDDALAEIYLAQKQRFAEKPGALQGDAWASASAALRQVMEQATDDHLQANAALLLGAMHEARGEIELATDHYRHATKLVPEDAGPYLALAVALAEQKRFAEAAEVQARVTVLDPDNLEAWLALGQLRIQAGDEEGGKQAYIDYERRRKGLIDGLTLGHDGTYRVSAQERVGCAEALASASDQGTGVALIYALETDPEVSVRQAVATAMGVQRLTMYRPVLEKHLKTETDAELKAAVTWALAEIERDPVEAAPPASLGEAAGTEAAREAGGGALVERGETPSAPAP